MEDFTPQPGPYQPRREPARSTNLSALVVVLIALGAVWLLPRFVESIQFAAVRGRERAEVEVAREQLAHYGVQPFVQIFEQVAKSIGPSVVHIDTIKAVGNRQDEWSYFFGHHGQQGFSEEQGSGVIIDAEGYILTNNHVVDGARELTVSLSDGRKIEADVVGSDPPTDLAVIKIDAPGLTPAPWGDSEALPVGAPVWAVGNPYGLDRSVTFGIISAKSRRGFGASPYQDFLQTDAAVNPGNSGGPLVNVQGEVVGINTAIVGKAYQGISFAIPSDTAHQVYDQLRSNRHVVRGYLGVQLDDELSPQMAKKLQLPDTHGALVREVVPAGPADQAGIEAGDVVVQWNGHPIENPTMLRLMIARTEVGAEIKCGIIRDGAPESRTVRVAELPSRPTVRRRPR
jgi:serine protease Do